MLISYYIDDVTYKPQRILLQRKQIDSIFVLRDYTHHMALFSGSPRTLNVGGTGYPREPANIRRTRAHALSNILFTYRPSIVKITVLLMTELLL